MNTEQVYTYNFFMKRPNDCGCWHNCNCPSDRYEMESFYSFKEAISFLKELIINDKLYYIQRTIINGVTTNAYGFKSPIHSYTNVFKFVNPIKTDENYAEYDVPEDDYRYEHFKSVTTALHELYVGLEAELKYFIIQKNEKMQKAITDAAKEKADKELAELARLKKLYPNA